MKVLVTGSTGFLGSSLLKLLSNYSFDVFPVIRNTLGLVVKKNDVIVSGIDSKTDWKNSLDEIDTVIHCAARVHVMKETSSHPIEVFREVNVLGTMNLAKAAVEAGVKRFIFISSIKVHGEHTYRDKPFSVEDICCPEDPYALSKAEGEEQLKELSKDTGMEVVIIRPPLIYGPGVKANFATMMRWVNKGIPLPLGGITENKRSLVSVDNLVSLIVTCIDHKNAANNTFLVSDDDDVSSTQLLASMAIALNVSNRLIPIPSKWFTMIAKLIGKPAISQRLCGSLQVDISKTKELLNWKPPYSSAESMKKTANAFLESLSSNKSLNK